MIIQSDNTVGQLAAELPWRHESFIGMALTSAVMAAENSKKPARPKAWILRWSSRKSAKNSAARPPRKSDGFRHPSRTWSTTSWLPITGPRRKTPTVGIDGPKGS